MVGVWITVLVFIVLLSALTFGISVYHRKYDNINVVVVVPTPEPTEEPRANETNEPDETEQPTQQPTQSYVKTAIIVEGNKTVVLASREAAEELIRNVERYFLSLGNMPDNAVTEMQAYVEFAAASKDDELTTYDEAFAFFTGSSTPLKYQTRSNMVVDKVIKHTDRISYDPTLPAGMRIVIRYGSDGIKRETYSAVYINGVLQSNTRLEAVTVVSPVGGRIVIGTMDTGEGFTLTPDFGAEPTAAQSMKFSAPAKGLITKYFGPADGSFHQGIDIKTDLGADVKAACAGTVVAVMERGAYGLMVEIEHNNGVTTRYAGLAKAFASLGEEVEAGFVIGTMDSASTQTVLHFELRIKGTAYNPLKILSESEITG